MTERFASLAAYRFIMDREKLRLEAYQPIVGDRWTIGWGTTFYPDGSPVRPGDRCTKEQADEWLVHHVEERCVRPLNEALRVPVNQQMFDALVSWVYNVGEEAMLTSTLMRKLNQHDYLGAHDEFDRWVFAQGKRSQGLQNRRDAEQELFKAGLRLAIELAKAKGWIGEEQIDDRLA